MSTNEIFICWCKLFKISLCAINWIQKTIVKYLLIVSFLSVIGERKKIFEKVSGVRSFTSFERCFLNAALTKVFDILSFAIKNCRFILRETIIKKHLLLIVPQLILLSVLTHENRLFEYHIMKHISLVGLVETCNQQDKKVD